MAIHFIQYIVLMDYLGFMINNYQFVQVMKIFSQFQICCKNVNIFLDYIMFRMIHLCICAASTLAGYQPALGWISRFFKQNIDVPRSTGFVPLLVDSWPDPKVQVLKMLSKEMAPALSTSGIRDGRQQKIKKKLSIVVTHTLICRKGYISFFTLSRFRRMNPAFFH